MKHQLVKQSPFNNVINHLFTNSFGDFAGYDSVSSTPLVNIIENDEAYAIHLAAPGIKKENVQITIEDGNLNVAYKQEETATEENTRVVRKEFKYQAFKRSFGLPDFIDTDAISASYIDGILTVSLPKNHDIINNKVKTIAIN